MVNTYSDETGGGPGREGPLMSSTSIELFRQHSEKQRQEAEEPKHKSQAQEQPSLVAEMSRIEHEVRQLFDRVSTAERDNIIRFLEVLIRKLKRQAGDE
jgi:hypothetical protein